MLGSAIASGQQASVVVDVAVVIAVMSVGVGDAYSQAALNPFGSDWVGAALAHSAALTVPEAVPRSFPSWETVLQSGCVQGSELTALWVPEQMTVPGRAQVRGELPVLEPSELVAWVLALGLAPWSMRGHWQPLEQKCSQQRSLMPGPSV
jgi:hypothetical protein